MNKKTKKTEPIYTEEPAARGWKFDAAKALGEAELRQLGMPTPDEAARLPARITHGGKRTGAGRKKTGNVRMQILISAKARAHIARVARREGKSLSAVIEARFAA